MIQAINTPNNFLHRGHQTTGTFPIMEDFISPITAPVISKLENADIAVKHADPSSTSISLFLDSGQHSVANQAKKLGIIGFKPTFNTISRAGTISEASSMDIVSILWPKTVKTSEITALFQVLSENTRKTPANSPLSAEKPTTISLADTPYIRAAFTVIYCSEFASNMMRFDGVRFGHRATDIKNLDQLYTHSRTAGFTAEQIQHILLGNFFTSSENFTDYFYRATQARTVLIEKYAKIFSNSPIVTSEDPEITLLASLIGCPALTINDQTYLAAPHQDLALLDFAAKELAK